MTTSGSKQHEMELALREVINALQDGQKGFAEAGEHLKDDSLKRYFMAESLKRARFRADLENELHRQGVADVKESGTTLGAVRRVWADLRVKLGGGDLALLEVTEEAEDAAKEVYRDALKQELPLPVHQMISEQNAHVLSSHDYVCAHRDIFRMRKAS